MATEALTQSQKTVRAALLAEGYSADAILHVLCVMRPEIPDDEPEDEDDAAWARQLNSTRACAQSKL